MECDDKDNNEKLGKNCSCFFLKLFANGFIK